MSVFRRATTFAPVANARRVISPTARSEDTDSDLMQDGLPREILIVASKLKAYVRARSGMNTSDNVVGILSDHLRRLCDEAIRSAARDGRKTVMERDFREDSR